MTDINKRKMKPFPLEEIDQDGRLSSEKERYHNALDVGYSIAAWVGFFSTIFVIVTILGQKPFQAAFFFNAVVTFLLFINGAAGFYFHYKRRLFAELMTLPSVIIGLIFVLLAYVIQTIHQILHDETVSVVAGMSGAFIMVFIIYMFSRYRFILSVIREHKINKKLIEKIEKIEAN